MKEYSEEEMLDLIIGKRGTPRREAHEKAIGEFLRKKASLQDKSHLNIQ